MKQEMIFRDRHIGLSEDERAVMLETLGLKSMNDLAAKVVPNNIRKINRMVIPRGIIRGRGCCEPESDCNEESGSPFTDRTGLLPHAYTGRHSAQCSRKPSLVYSLHAVPTRNFSGRLELFSTTRRWSLNSPEWPSLMPPCLTRVRLLLRR